MEAQTPKKKSMISLVGRPNVGKSSLFNALVGKKKALVMDFEGVTRDRRIESVKVEALADRNVKVCDTGGWMPENWRKGREDKETLKNIEDQILKALEESAVIVLVMDIRIGPTALDRELVEYIRKLNTPFVIAANKCDDPMQGYELPEFFELGADDLIPVSAEHKRGIVDFWERIEKFLPEDQGPGLSDDGVIRVCIVGRPNVGKSSLLNRIVGEARSVASSIPGTTTDPVDVEIERQGQRFLLVDTAGIRRHAKRENDVEDLGVFFATRNLDKADVALLVIDAEEGITTQDSRIAKLVEESGCACIVLANKWDNAPHAVKSDSKDGIKKFREILDAEWPFLDFAPLVAMSAEKGKVYGATPGADALEPLDGPWRLPRYIEEIWILALDLIEARKKVVSPAELKEVIEEALSIGPNWIEDLGDFRRLHQVGHRPPQFIANVRDANKVPEALRRYLKRTMRERFGFRGNPIRWVFRHKR
ncbi:MAG: ribosome biogenesis GTPase Der [Bdellovibrionota bacterium]